MALSEKYNEMYGDGENFSENVNKNIFRNATNNYTNDDFNNDNAMNRSLNNDNAMNRSSNNTSTNNTLWYIFLFIILGSILFALFYFRDNIIQMYRDVIKPKPNVNNELRQLNKSIKEEKEKREEKEKERELKSKKEKGGVNQFLNKINYNSNQIAKEDGYCYIGYDRGMRNCSEIHQGETCMSGDIFPSLEICMFPNLRE
jgi:hypothetical protein